jgi:hypothetical protein
VQVFAACAYSPTCHGGFFTNATSAYPVRNRRDGRTSLDLVNIN